MSKCNKRAMDRYVVKWKKAIQWKYLVWPRYLPDDHTTLAGFMEIWKEWMLLVQNSFASWHLYLNACFLLPIWLKLWFLVSFNLRWGSILMRNNTSLLKTDKISINFCHFLGLSWCHFFFLLTLEALFACHPTEAWAQWRITELKPFGSASCQQKSNLIRVDHVFASYVLLNANTHIFIISVPHWALWLMTFHNHLIIYCSLIF